MTMNFTRITMVLLLAATSVVAADAKPTLVGSAYDIVMTRSEGTTRDGKKEKGKTETCTWTFTAGSINVASEQGHLDSIPYTVTWSGRTAQITAGLPSKGAKIDAVVDGKGLRGKCSLDPRVAEFFHKVPTMTITGTLRALPTDVGSTLVKAKELQLQRKPKEAAVLFAKIVDEQPANFEFSLPALTSYVACCQMLKDDPAIITAYAALAKKHHLTLPNLDGTTALDAGAAEKGLLWGKLGDGTSLVWKVERASWSTNDNKVGSKSYLWITLTAQSDLTLLNDNDNDELRVTAVTKDGTTYSGKASVSSGSRNEIRLSVNFDTIPTTVDRLASLEVSVPLAQPKTWLVRETPLRENESWETPIAQGSIARIVTSDEGRKVDIKVVDRSPQRRSGSSSSSSSSRVRVNGKEVWPAGELADPGTHPPFAIKDQAGALALPGGDNSTNTAGNTTTHHLLFPNPYPGFVPVSLVATTVAEKSVHRITALVKDVELP